MRFEHLMQLVQRRGFYFGTNLVPYVGPRSKVIIPSFGTNRKMLQDFSLLAERPRPKIHLLTRPIRIFLGPTERLKSLGLQALHWSYNHISVAAAYAWRLILRLKISHFRAFRYCLGLPVRGQRTHDNAHSVRRGQGPHVSLVGKLIGIRVFFWSRAKAPTTKKRPPSKGKGGAKKGAKLPKGKAKGVKKKKVDVWR